MQTFLFSHFLQKRTGACSMRRGAPLSMNPSVIESTTKFRAAEKPNFSLTHPCIAHSEGVPHGMCRPRGYEFQAVLA